MSDPKPKYIFILLVLISLLGVANGQDEKSRHLFPVLKNGRWGYIDQMGRLIIECKFGVASYWSDRMINSFNIDYNWTEDSAATEKIMLEHYESGPISDFFGG